MNKIEVLANGLQGKGEIFFKIIEKLAVAVGDEGRALGCLEKVAAVSLLSGGIVQCCGTPLGDEGPVTS